MNLNTLTQGEPWMTPQERNINHHLIGALAQFLADAGVPETALIALRVNDLAVTWLLARRLESALAPAEGESASCPTPAQANAIGRCRDRLRRAIKELEACCPRNTTPARQGPGLIEQMHEAVRVVRATGILDEPAAADNGNDHVGQMHQVANQLSETNPNNEIPNHNETRTADKPEPEPPSANPAEAPPPPNRKARRLQAREERRNRTGRSKRPLGRTAAQSPRSNDIPEPSAHRTNQTVARPNAGVRPDPG
jgi:hypothetical protein